MHLPLKPLFALIFKNKNTRYSTKFGFKRIQINKYVTIRLIKILINILIGLVKQNK